MPYNNTVKVRQYKYTGTLPEILDIRRSNYRRSHFGIKIPTMYLKDLLQNHFG